MRVRCIDKSVKGLKYDEIYTVIKGPYYHKGDNSGALRYVLLEKPDTSWFARRFETIEDNESLNIDNIFEEKLKNIQNELQQERDTSSGRERIKEL